jgi:uncharacterized short protein YbdD (DUF466 family)
VVVEAVIKGLCIGAFVAHLAQEKPSTIEELYREFEKYCRSDNDLQRRLEEQNQSKQYQGNNRSTQRGNRSQGQSQPHQPSDQQVFNIEQQGNSQQGQYMPVATPSKAPQKQYEGKKYNQKKNWNKN